MTRTHATVQQIELSQVAYAESTITVSTALVTGPEPVPYSFFEVAARTDTHPQRHTERRHVGPAPGQWQVLGQYPDRDTALAAHAGWVKHASRYGIAGEHRFGVPVWPVTR